MSTLNDPRVFFAAERTLLAWNRTSLTLLAFGFAIERFDLFVRMLSRQGEPLGRDLSFWIGIAFVLLGSLASTASTWQYQRILKSLTADEIPPGYLHVGIATNLAVAILGAALLVYLFRTPGF